MEAGRGGFCLLDRTKESFRRAFEEGDGPERGRPDQELTLDLRDLSGRGVG